MKIAFHHHAMAPPVNKKKAIWKMHTSLLLSFHDPGLSHKTETTRVVWTTLGEFLGSQELRRKPDLLKDDIVQAMMMG